MTDVIAFQQFVPLEHNNEKRCIWCKKITPKNRAHIISRRLSNTSHPSTVLRYGVCKECNSKCSEIEMWVLRNTPLGWTRFFFYPQSNRMSNTNAIPSYFYAPDLKEWLVYKGEGNRSSKTINSQLYLSAKDGIQLIAEKSPEEAAGKILESIRNHSYVTDVRSTLPDDFSPRALIDGDIVLVIARTEKELDGFIDMVLNSELRKHILERKQLIDSGLHRQHFKWSKANWLKFSAKISYETLCLFEGAGRCLEPEFERVRSYVMSGAAKKHRELVFDEHGPVSDDDVPLPLGVDMSVGQNYPHMLSALLINVEPGMHSVSIYEIDGWVCSSVSISGFPPSSMVLGGPDSHLRDLYGLIYDEKVDDFDFIRLAFDLSRPIIPLPIRGDISKSIARTYRLRNEKVE